MATVLTVEDDELTREVIVDILERAGHTVLEATNAQECFNQLSQQPETALILLDVMLTGRSGWDIFTALQHEGRGDHLAVVFVSALDISPERLATLKEAGVIDYLVKPFTSEQLLTAVATGLPKADENTGAGPDR